MSTALADGTVLTSRIIFLFSLTCALAVANVYSVQPLLDSIAVSLNVSPGITGSIVTVTQAGYALGLIFLVPLGDRFDRKTLVITHLILSVLALAAAALAQDLIMLLCAMLLVGLMAVVVQLVVAWSAMLAAPRQRASGLALALLTVSWLPIAFLDASLWWLVAGIIMLDFAVQTVHVINQSIIIAARPEAASRLVGAYMCFYSAGSAAGAIVATQLYAQWGWQSVCYAGAFVSACAFIFWFGSRRS